jgi:hypothetical protein
VVAARSESYLPIAALAEERKINARMLRGMRDNLRAMRTCHEMGRWLQHFLDGELDIKTREEVEEHLRTCVRCGMEFDTYAKIKEALRETSQQSPFMIEDEVAIERLRRFANHLVGTNDGGRD